MCIGSKSNDVLCKDLYQCAWSAKAQQNIRAQKMHDIKSEW